VYTYGDVIYNYIKVGKVFSFFKCDSKNRTVMKSSVCVSLSLSLPSSPVDNIAAVFRTVGIFSPPEAVCQPPACENATTTATTITIYRYACAERVVELSSVPRQIAGILNYTHCTYYANRTLHTDAVYNNTSRRESAAAI